MRQEQIEDPQTATLQNFRLKILTLDDLLLEDRPTERRQDRARTRSLRKHHTEKQQARGDSQSDGAVRCIVHSLYSRVDDTGIGPAASDARNAVFYNVPPTKSSREKALFFVKHIHQPIMDLAAFKAIVLNLRALRVIKEDLEEMFTSARHVFQQETNNMEQQGIRNAQIRRSGKDGKVIDCLLLSIPFVHARKHNHNHRSRQPGPHLPWASWLPGAQSKDSTYHSTGLAGGSAYTGSPDYTLLQTLNPNYDSRHDLKQAICRMLGKSGTEYLCVSYLWAVMISDEMLITCSIYPASDLYSSALAPMATCASETATHETHVTDLRVVCPDQSVYLLHRSQCTTSLDFAAHFKDLTDRFWDDFELYHKGAVVLPHHLAELMSTNDEPVMYLQLKRSPDSEEWAYQRHIQRLVTSLAHLEYTVPNADNVAKVGEKLDIKSSFLTGLKKTNLKQLAFAIEHQRSDHPFEQGVTVAQDIHSSNRSTVHRDDDADLRFRQYAEASAGTLTGEFSNGLTAWCSAMSSEAASITTATQATAFDDCMIFGLLNLELHVGAGSRLDGARLRYAEICSGLRQLCRIMKESYRGHENVATLTTFRKITCGFVSALSTHLSPRDQAQRSALDSVHSALGPLLSAVLVLEPYELSWQSLVDLIEPPIDLNGVRIEAQQTLVKATELLRASELRALRTSGHRHHNDAAAHNGLPEALEAGADSMVLEQMAAERLSLDSRIETWISSCWASAASVNHMDSIVARDKFRQPYVETVVDGYSESLAAQRSDCSRSALDPEVQECEHVPPDAGRNATPLEDADALMAYVGEFFAGIHEQDNIAPSESLSGIEEVVAVAREQLQGAHKSAEHAGKQIAAAFDQVLDAKSTESLSSRRAALPQDLLDLLIGRLLHLPVLKDTSRRSMVERDVFEMYLQYSSELENTINVGEATREPLERLRSFDPELNAFAQIQTQQMTVMEWLDTHLDGPDQHPGTPSRGILQDHVMRLKNENRVVQQLSQLNKSLEEEVSSSLVPNPRQALNALGNLIVSECRFHIETLDDWRNNATVVFAVISIIFLPLSFVTGLLGMKTNDVRNMGFGQWIFWSSAVPFTLLVILITLWLVEVPPLKRWFERH